MIKLAVIGDPIEHSLSPSVHGAVLDALGVSYTYQKVRVKKGGLDSFLRYVEDEKIDGFNLTMPHKTDIIPYLSYIDGEAERYGAVNTVEVRNGKLYGYNTDGRGFAEALRINGFSFVNKSAVIAGAGGAVRPIAMRLLSEGIIRLTILNRTPEKAAKLCRELETAEGVKIFYDTLEPNTLSRYTADCDLFINGTSLGMEGVNADFTDLYFLKKMKKDALVSDLIYRPARTKLLKYAEAEGLRALNGLSMLICQGILSDRIYTGIDFDMKKMFEAAKEKIAP